MRRLHNEDWGFSSNCFVCEPRNDGGLQIPFWHDAAEDCVVARFNLADRFSGAPAYVHGGITLAVLDEAMAWAAIAIGGKFAVTAETSTQFHRALRIGSDYRVRAEVTSQVEERIDATAEITFADDKLCAEATGSFTVLGAAQAVQATGADLDAIDPSYLR